MATGPLRMSEAELQAAVLDSCAAFGWLVHHDRPARTQRGWRTAVEGNAGFPDLVIVHKVHGCLFRELKGERGLVAPDQQEWLDALSATGADVGIWFPSDWRSGLIDRTLRGLR